MISDLTPHKSNAMLPLKSVAVALLFCAVLGPIGLLYSSFTGGVIMIVIGLLMVRTKLIGLIILTWVISCIWGVAAVNRYNIKMTHMHQ